MLHGRTEYQGNVNPASYKGQKAQTRRREKAMTSVAKKIFFLFFKFPSFPPWTDFVKKCESQILNKCLQKKRSCAEAVYEMAAFTPHAFTS